MTADSASLAEAARRGDPQRYLTALFAPVDLREDFLTLYAFNGEVARTRDAVSEPVIGQIRLQWWREAIEEAFAGRPRRHEVVSPLATSIARRKLPREPFDRLIDARERDLDDERFADLEEFLAYCRETAEPLAELGVALLGETAPDVAAAARGVATGYAIVGNLRAAAYREARRRPVLPRALLERHGADIRAVSELKADEGTRRAVRELVDLAARELEAARHALARPRRRLAPVLMPGCLARIQASRISAAGFDPFAPEFAIASPFDVWRLAFAHLCRRY